MAESVAPTVKLGFIDYNGTLEVRNSLLNVILRDKPLQPSSSQHSS